VFNRISLRRRVTRPVDQHPLPPDRVELDPILSIPATPGMVLDGRIDIHALALAQAARSYATTPGQAGLPQVALTEARGRIWDALDSFLVAIAAEVDGDDTEPYTERMRTLLLNRAARLFPDVLTHTARAAVLRGEDPQLAVETTAALLRRLLSLDAAQVIAEETAL